MSLMTGPQYIDSLQQMSPRAYLFGERIENPTDHPMIKPSQNAIALTYEMIITRARGLSGYSENVRWLSFRLRFRMKLIKID
jgi:aromatic ring hydroxylase